MNDKKKRGKRELRDYLCEKFAETKQKQAEIAGELVRLEMLMGIVDKIVEIKK